MPDISFDDLVPQQTQGDNSSINFDDLVPAAPSGNNAGPWHAAGEALANAIPAGQKITNAMGAGIAKAASPITGDTRSFNDLYNQAQADTAATESANPISSLAGTAAGILPTLPVMGAAGKAIGAGIGAIPGGEAAIGALSRLGTPTEGAGALERAANLGIRSAKGAAMAAPIGAVYGAANDTTGNPEDSAISGASTAAEIGAALPVAGAAMASVGNRLGTTKNLISNIGRKAGQEIGAISPPPSPVEAEFSNITGKPLSQTPQNLTGNLPLSPGVQAKDPDLLRVEENARQGLLGPEMQGKMKEYDAGVLQAAKDSMQQLKGVTNDDSDTSLANAVKTFQDHAAVVKQQAQNLYKQRDSMMADAVLDKTKVGPSLGSALSTVATDPSNVAGFKSKSGAPAAALLQDFRDLITGAKGKELPFSDLAAWRQDVSHLALTDQSTAGNMAGKLGKAYDNWMDNISQNHFISGDPEIASTAKAASSAWKNYKNLFGSENSPVIEGMVKPYDATPADFVNKVFGASIKGNQNTALNMRKMIAALPEEARPQFKDRVFSGLISKAFEGANKGDNVSLANLRNNLSSLQNSQVFKETWANDPDKAPVIENLINDLTQHLSQTGRRDVYSPSGGAVMRGINALVGIPAKIPLVKSIPGVKGVAQLGNIASEYSQNYLDRSAFANAVKTAQSVARNKSVLDFDGLRSAVTSGAIGGMPKPPVDAQPQEQSNSVPEPVATLPPPSPLTPPPSDQHSENTIGDVLDKIKTAESNGDPNAKNPNSSAVGPYQFTQGTWNDMVNKYGANTNISANDRTNPEAQETMAALLARDNAVKLAQNLGRTPTTGEIYMAHFLGPDGALNLINSNPSTPAKALFPPDVIKSNRSIFFDRARPRTAKEVYDLLDQKVS